MASVDELDEHSFSPIKLCCDLSSSGCVNLGVSFHRQSLAYLSLKLRHYRGTSVGLRGPMSSMCNRRAIWLEDGTGRQNGVRPRPH